MKYLKKILKKWRLIDKLTQEANDIAQCMYMSTVFDGYNPVAMQHYLATRRALNKLKNL